MFPQVKGSIQDCHVKGLDSIVFKAKEPMVRMYYARPDHNLWQNQIGSGLPMSLGIHSHRRDITITPIFGIVYNILFASPAWTANGSRHLTEYLFHSTIKEGKGGFEKVDITYGRYLKEELITAPRFMHSSEHHSVYVPKGKQAAWLICEGEPARVYNPYLWTDQDVLNLDTSDLYQPMKEERFWEDIGEVSRHCRLD